MDDQEHDQDRKDGDPGDFGGLLSTPLTAQEPLAIDRKLQLLRAWAEEGKRVCQSNMERVDLRTKRAGLNRSRGPAEWKITLKTYMEYIIFPETFHQVSHGQAPGKDIASKIQQRLSDKFPQGYDNGQNWTRAQLERFWHTDTSSTDRLAPVCNLGQGFFNKGNRSIIVERLKAERERGLPKENEIEWLCERINEWDFCSTPTNETSVIAENESIFSRGDPDLDAFSDETIITALRERNPKRRRNYCSPIFRRDGNLSRKYWPWCLVERDGRQILTQDQIHALCGSSREREVFERQDGWAAWNKRASEEANRSSGILQNWLGSSTQKRVLRNNENGNGDSDGDEVEVKGTLNRPKRTRK